MKQVARVLTGIVAIVLLWAGACTRDPQTKAQTYAARGDAYMAKHETKRALMALIAHMRSAQFIRPNLEVDLLKAERVEDILPRLKAYAARVPESAKAMAPEVARRM